MVRYYEIYCQNRFMGVYRAMSADDAITQAYMKTGSASKYTGNGRHMYKAKEV